jgi:alpha-galactosidase/6-phospho-beta-glucosidase family protein
MLLVLHLVHQESKKDPKKKEKREKAEISTALWTNEKAQSTLNVTN